MAPYNTLKVSHQSNVKFYRQGTGPAPFFSALTSLRQQSHACSRQCEDSCGAVFHTHTHTHHILAHRCYHRNHRIHHTSVCCQCTCRCGTGTDAGHILQVEQQLRPNEPLWATYVDQAFQPHLYWATFCFQFFTLQAVNQLKTKINAILRFPYNGCLDKWKMSSSVQWKTAQIGSWNLGNSDCKHQKQEGN